MKNLSGIIGAMSLLTVVFLAFFPLVLSVYGLYLAFTTSLVLGVLVLLVEPTPLLLGILGIFGYTDVAHKIAVWLGLV